MPQLITINAAHIERLTYKDQPVVTFEMIATVHGISLETVRSAFYRHRARFTAEKHFYRIDFIEASQLFTSATVSQNGVVLFTQKGYLLLTKPMRDAQSWRVQEQMIDEYFSLRDPVPRLPVVHDTAMQMLIDMAYKHDAALQDIARIKQQQYEQALELIAHQKTALEAKDLALLALHSQAWVTIRQYVAMHKDLAPVLPEALQRAFASHLGQVCREHGSPMYKAHTADSVWPDERTYCLALIDETLPGWLKRRQAQMSLVPARGGRSRP